MVAVRGYRWDHRWRVGATLLALTAALVSALAVVDPARADDAPTAPADPAATTTQTPAAPAADPAADAPASPDPDPPTPDPGPPPPPDPAPTESPAPEDPASTGGTTGAPADPAPDAPAGDPVAVEPDPPTDPVTTCAEASGADGAQGACEPAGGSTAPASPPAACDKTAADAAASACTEQDQASTPAAATTPKVAPTSATPAAQPAAPASELVVTLAPASATTVPVPTGPAVAPAGEPEDPVLIGSPVVSSAPVQLVQPIVPVAKIAAGVSSGPALEATPTSGILAPAVTATSLAHASVVPAELPRIPIATLVSAGARAAPPETDEGHIEAAVAKPPPEPEAIDPFTPFDVHGPGAGVGRGGGVPGAASSFRHVAIVPTPLGFAYPSAFAYSPAPSSAPAGALEDAPTTRPG